MPPQSRRFCLTSYAEKPPQFDELYHNYMCYQQEACPTSNKLHWQCYFETITKRLPQAVLKRLRKEVGEGVSIHLEVAQASLSKNKKYCCKEESAIPDTFKEFGMPLAQGERSDIQEYMEAAQTMSEIELMRNFPSTYARNPHLRSRVRNVMMREAAMKPRDVCVIWIYGPPGTGKTHYAWKHAYELSGDAYISPSSKWFDGYDGEMNIIIDDLAPGDMDRNLLLRITDKWPFQLPVKGSHVWARYNSVYITSNYNPKEFNLPPLCDRIRKIIYMDGESYRKQMRELDLAIDPHCESEI